MFPLDIFTINCSNLFFCVIWILFSRNSNTKPLNPANLGAIRQLHDCMSLSWHRLQDPSLVHSFGSHRISGFRNHPWRIKSRGETHDYDLYDLRNFNVEYGLVEDPLRTSLAYLALHCVLYNTRFNGHIFFTSLSLLCSY